MELHTDCKRTADDQTPFVLIGKSPETIGSQKENDAVAQTMFERNRTGYESMTPFIRWMRKYKWNPNFFFSSVGIDALMPILTKDVSIRRTIHWSENVLDANKHFNASTSHRTFNCVRWWEWERDPIYPYQSIKCVNRQYLPRRPSQ